MMDRQLLCEWRNFIRHKNLFASFDNETRGRTVSTFTLYETCTAKIILHWHRARCHELHDRHIVWNKMKPKEAGGESGIPCGPWTSELPISLGKATSASDFNSLFPISVTIWGPLVALKYLIACNEGLEVDCVPHTSHWQSSFTWKASVFHFHPCFWYIQDTGWELNLLNTKRRMLYLKTQFVPRSKHFPPRL